MKPTKFDRNKYSWVLRFYPPSWRKSNGEVFLAMLEDDAAARGLSRMPIPEVIRLVLYGLRERFLPYSPVGLISKISLAFSLFVAIFYTLLIAWSPAGQGPGQLGPFANPSVITGIGIFLAYCSAALNRTKTMRFFAKASALIATSLFLLGQFERWQGPGVEITVIFSLSCAIAHLNLGLTKNRSQTRYSVK